MQSQQAKILLGFPPNSLPSPSQVKAAYRRKVLETHPDRFPDHQKAKAECKFKLISEAYTFLNSDNFCDKFSRLGSAMMSELKIVPTASASYSRVMRSGVPRTHGGQRNIRAASVPFFFIILGALTLGGATASRAYKRQKETHPSFNPFLP